jgi:hypothetical protein
VVYQKHRLPSPFSSQTHLDSQVPSPANPRGSTDMLPRFPFRDTQSTHRAIPLQIFIWQTCLLPSVIQSEVCHPNSCLVLHQTPYTSPAGVGVSNSVVLWRSTNGVDHTSPTVKNGTRASRKHRCPHTGLNISDMTFVLAATHPVPFRCS